MNARGHVYFAVLLLAMILALLPAAMFIDMIVPMEGWENWYWKGQPHPRPEFSLQNPPALFRAEVLAYKSLVAPPAWLRRLITGWPTAYGSFFMRPHRETAGLPPLAHTLEHLTWAVPFWFILLVLVAEVGSATRRAWRARAV